MALAETANGPRCPTNTSPTRPFVVVFDSGRLRPHSVYTESLRVPGASPVNRRAIVCPLSVAQTTGQSLGGTPRKGDIHMSNFGTHTADAVNSPTHAPTRRVSSETKASSKTS